MRTRRTLRAIATAAVLVAASVTVEVALALPAAADDAAADQPSIETVAPTDEAGIETVAPTDEAGIETVVSTAVAGIESVAPTEADAEVGALAADHGALWASVDLYRVVLSDGALMGTTRGHVASVAPNVGASMSNIYSVSGTYNDPAETGLDATVVYRIRMDMPNAPEENTWLKTRVYVSGGSSYAQCEIYKGDPRAGGSVMDPGAYTCFPRKTQNFPNVRYTFAVEMNRYVESSGTIRTVGPVSLARGDFTFEQPFRIAGSASVATGGTTTFSTVMRESDTGISIDPDTAKTWFSYNILETHDVAGVPTAVPSKYYIAGIVSRNRSGSNQTSCWVFDVDPTLPTPWQDIKIPRAAPFTCTATGERVDSGHLAATIIVAKRDITVIPATERPRQSELYRDVCANRPDDCDLRLATVVKTTGEERVLTGKWENREHAVPVTHVFKFESKQSITSTFGTELTLGVEGGIGVKYKAEIKASFEYEIANETSLADEQEVEIERGRRAFMVGAPTIVHTEGDIYVLRGDRLFLLQGVIADFPLAGNADWDFWDESEPIPGWTAGGGLGGVQNPPAADPDPAAPAAAEVTAGRVASGKGSLAQTGGSVDAWTFVLAAGLPLAGGLLLFARRRRPHSTE